MLPDPKGREAMVRSVIEGGLSRPRRRVSSTHPKTVAKWVERSAEGVMDYGIAPPGLMPSQTAPDTAQWSRRCAGSATRAGRCAETGYRRQRQPHLRRLGLNRIRDWSRPSRCAAMSGHSWRDDPHRYQEARSSTRSVTASPVIGTARATVAASAGSSSTSHRRSRASRSPRSSETRRPIAPFPSSRRPWPTTKASA